MQKFCFESFGALEASVAICVVVCAEWKIHGMDANILSSGVVEGCCFARCWGVRVLLVGALAVRVV